MEVRATADGFYGGARRRAGQTFTVPAGETANWFEPTNPEDAAKPKAKAAAKPKAKADKAPAATDTPPAGDTPPADDSAADDLA